MITGAAMPEPFRARCADDPAPDSANADLSVELQESRAEPDMSTSSHSERELLDAKRALEERTQELAAVADRFR